MSPRPREYVAKDGTKSYRVRFRHGGKNTSETFPTPRAALAFCADLEYHGPDEAIRRHLETSAQDDTPTLDEMFAEWIDRADRRVRSDRTTSDYRRDWANWISPTLGHRSIGALTAGDVQEWIDSMDKGDKRTGRKPLSPKSIADRHAILHGVCKWAASSARKGGPVITSDPCAGTTLPKRRARPPKGLLPAEWQALHAALTRIDKDAADLSLFMLSTGWRWSEATALTSYSVEDDGVTMHASTGWVIRRNAAGQHVRVEDTKSDRSRRRTLLDASTAAVVRKRRATINGDGLVFTTATGAQWHYSNFQKRAWQPAVKAANLSRNPTPHWLRHTHAGWLLMSGAATLADVQARLGHANITTTVDIYGSLVQDAPALAVDAMAAMRDGRPLTQIAPETPSIEP